MNYRFYTLVYAFTLLLSAALLFSVQPMFSKMILPMLGGTPQVWNTAMVFFQAVLLAGYAYAHIISHISSTRVQAFIHLSILLLCSVALPIAIPEGWDPTTTTNPTLWQLSLMTVVVGGPFFALSGSAPLFQKWFAQTDHPDAENPYFLYGASNLGSMSALIAYPFVIEPLADLQGQAYGWMMGYIALTALVVLCAALVWRSSSQVKTSKITKKSDDTVTWKRRFTWLLLAFIPSSLMLGVTTYITSEIASAPLLWIIPLALYVCTFILVFARTPLFTRDQIMRVFGLAIIGLLAYSLFYSSKSIWLMPFHLLVFFLSALACHTELAHLRPKASKLTEFYLIMSLGGVLGGIFNAIIAPQFFVIPLEYAGILGLSCFMRYIADEEKITSLKDHPPILYAASLAAIALGVACFFISYSQIIAVCIFGIVLCLAILLKYRLLFAAPVLVILFLFPPGHIWGQSYFTNILHQDRNFFGIVRVVETDTERLLVHGVTNHGTQALDEKYKMEPLSYYSAQSPLRQTFSYFDQKAGPQRVGVIGLGIGVVSCLEKEDRHFDFYEIDENVIDIAENPEYFTFLSDCGSDYDIIRGDGRLQIQKQPDEYYDLIIIDAFTSDNIPAHLLTREATDLYISKLKPDGALVFNITNTYLDLEPVLSEVAKNLDIPGYARLTLDGSIPDTDIYYLAAQFFSMSYNQDYNKTLTDGGWSTGRFRDGVKLWTDKYSNIVSVFGLTIAEDRFHEAIENRKKDDH